MHDSLWTGSIAELLVAYRFIEAGRRPAWPLTVCSYDLLVDGGDDIFRVQVKHARKMDKAGRWYVRLAKKKLGSVVDSANYDYLCAVADANLIFVIPTGAFLAAHDPTRPLTSIVVGKEEARFGPYLNRFELGLGEHKGQEYGQLDPLKGVQRLFWQHSLRKRSISHKPYRRLSKQDVAALRLLPIRFYKADPS